ncbi:MAG: HAD family hydrolase [Thermodesulfobacteriota bacterium]
MKNIERPEGVIFDLGGVILDFDHMVTCRPLAELSGMAPEEVFETVFASGLERLYDKGKITTDEFYAEGLSLLGIPRAELPPERFREAWNRIFTLKADVVDIVRGLRGKTRLFMLSNTNELHWEYAAREHPVLSELFDDIFLSFRLGARKPEPEIFRKVIDAIGIPAKGLFYVDDLAGHVEAARRAGIEGLVFTTPGELAGRLASLGL